MISPAILACAPSSGPAPYQGPLDIVPGAVVAYSQRAMSAAKRGTALYTIFKEDGVTSQSFSSDATTGDAPASAIQAFIGAPFNRIGATDDTSSDIVMTSVAGIVVGQIVTGTDFDPTTTYAVIAIDAGALTISLSSGPVNTNPTSTITFVPQGYCSVWIDQSGSGLDQEQATPADQPRWLAAQSGVLPALAFNTGSIDPKTQFLVTSGNISLSGGSYTAFFVARGAPSSVQYVAGFNYWSFGGNGNVFAIGTNGDSGSNIGTFLDSSSDGDTTNQAGAAGGRIPYDATLNQIYDQVAGTGTAELKINNAVDPISDDYNRGTVGDLSGWPLYLGNADVPGPSGSGGYFNYVGSIVEVIIYSERLSISARNDIRQNIAAYYGITLS